MKGKEERNLSDEEIVVLILEKKNPKLFEILYERYSKRIFNKCLGFVKERDLAEDLSHDIILKVYLSLKGFSHKSKFSTWVFSITYNACVDFKNKHTKNSTELDRYVVEKNELLQEDTKLDEELFALKSSRLENLMDEIQAEEKAILLLKYQDDLSVKEISIAMELSESAIKMRLKRGRDKLLNLYKDRYAHHAT